MRKLLLLPALFLFCGFVFTDKVPEWKLLISGKNSGVMEHKTMLFSNKKQFIKGWLELRKSDYSLPESPPGVDFKEKVVIACYAGTQTNGLEADSLWNEKGNLCIRLTRISLGKNCHNAKLLVTPFVIIEIDRVGWNVVKEVERVRIIDCKE